MCTRPLPSPPCGPQLGGSSSTSTSQKTDPTPVHPPYSSILHHTPSIPSSSVRFPQYPLSSLPPRSAPPHTLIGHFIHRNVNILSTFPFPIHCFCHLGLRLRIHPSLWCIFFPPLHLSVHPELLPINTYQSIPPYHPIMGIFSFLLCNVTPLAITRPNILLRSPIS